MKIKKHIKNIMGAAITVAALSSGSASADEFTGTIHWFSTADDGYTFVNVLPTSGGTNRVAYYTGTNSAIATVIDNAKRLNQEVTVVTAEGGWNIIQVR